MYQSCINSRFEKDAINPQMPFFRFFRLLHCCCVGINKAVLSVSTGNEKVLHGSFFVTTTIGITSQAFIGLKNLIP